MELSIYLFIAVIALVMGSFLNACIYRLPEKTSMWQRSACPVCNENIQWYDLVPVLSYFILAGKCRHCKNKISLQYPVIELAAVLISLFFFYTNGLDWLSVKWTFLLYIILVMIVIDFKHFIIPNVLVAAILILGGFQYIISPGLFMNGLLGAISAAGIPVLAMIINYQLKGEAGFGLGDVKLLAAIGFVTGYPAGFLILFLAAVAGSIVGIVGIISKRLNRKSKIPFGVFIGFAVYGFLVFDLLLVKNF